MSFAQRIRLQHEVLELPLVARLYRGGFKSGCGAKGSGLRRLISRAGFYLHRGLAPFRSYGAIQILVRGEPRVIRFDVGNRQFTTLYFQQFLEHGYEPEVAAVISELLPDDGVFFDVGANWGHHSLLVAARPEFRGRVYAFEPWPPSFVDLRETMRQANLADWVVCHPIALGDRSGSVSMHCPGHSGLTRVTVGGRGPTIEQQPLDELSLPAPQLLKIDAEGSELAVLRGAEQTLEVARPLLILENDVAGSEGSAGLDVLRFLRDRRYDLFAPLVEYAGDGPRYCSAGLAGRPGYEPIGLRLMPVAAEARHAYPHYLNVLACPAERAGALDRYLLDAFGRRSQQITGRPAGRLAPGPSNAVRR